MVPSRCNGMQSMELSLSRNCKEAVEAQEAHTQFERMLRDSVS